MKILKRNKGGVMVLAVICTIISSITTILCVYLAARNNKYQKKVLQLAAQRAEEGTLMLAMIHSIGKLSVGTALAIKNDKSNGELEEGLNAVEDCQKSYALFMENIAMVTLRN